jgi:hypothetical protein
MMPKTKTPDVKLRASHVFALARLDDKGTIKVTTVRTEQAAKASIVYEFDLDEVTMTATEQFESAFGISPEMVIAHLDLRPGRNSIAKFIMLAETFTGRPITKDAAWELSDGGISVFAQVVASEVAPAPQA